MPASLQIQLLGSFAALLDDQPIHSFRSAKARALLAFLAAQPDQAHARSSLATLFWGDLPDAAARTNLRIELSNLKKLLSAHPALVITRDAVRVDSLLLPVDAVRFREGVTTFLALPAETQATQLHRLSAALDGYRGEFLDGFHLEDSPDFEDWQRTTREHLHELMMQALETLQIRYAEQARWDELAAVARRQLAVQPWHEPAHRRLIQALAAQGQAQAALAQYKICCTVLEDELGVEPSAETVELAARLRGDTTTQAPVRHNLPPQLKSFVGRAAEVEQLCELVQSERLVTLLGIGGVGKSRLAQAVAQQALHYFAQGVWFVPLANIRAGDAAHQQIALTIAAAIGLQVTDTQTPLRELIAYLADHEMLLVLDNWDHLTHSAADLLYPLLEETPIRVLATSRARLQIEGEAVVRLDGLQPADGFALFVDRARRIVPDFAVSQEIDDPAGIFRICEQVGGLPLGIELAASWVEHFTIAEISRSVAEIEVEPQQSDEFVQRHQRIRTIFEYSWRLLSPSLQQILARLSVFRGGFDREAAVAVAASTLTDLSVLIGHSLVQRVLAGRYDLHPLILEFAAQKLSEDKIAQLHATHSRHYLSILASINRSEQSTHLRADAENVRSAWQRAVHAGDAQILAPAATPFSEFMAQFGLLGDGETLLQDAAERFQHDDKQRELVAQLLHQQWRFTRALRGMTVAENLLHRVLATSQDAALQLQIHSDLSTGYAETGAWEDANCHFDAAEALARRLTDPLAYIRTVESRIHVNALHFRGDLQQGIVRLQEMFRLLDAIPDPGAAHENMRFQLSLSLALVAMRYGDYALALKHSLENLEYVTHLNHRHKRVWCLLDLALIEQFAGLYPAAVEHNLEALSLAEEINALDDKGLLSANFCLMLRPLGKLEEGLAYGQRGAQILHTLGIARQEGQARNRIGNTLLALQRWDEAYAAYADALAVWEPLRHPNRIEAVAGRAVAAHRLGHHQEAMRLVDETLSFIESNGLVGVVEPVLLSLHCEDVLRSVGQTTRAQQVLEIAQTWVHTIAGRISDEDVRASFLERPDHRVLGQRLGGRIREGRYWG